MSIIDVEHSLLENLYVTRTRLKGMTTNNIDIFDSKKLVYNIRSFIYVFRLDKHTKKLV